MATRPENTESTTVRPMSPKAMPRPTWWRESPATLAQEAAVFSNSCEAQTPDGLLRVVISLFPD